MASTASASVSNSPPVTPSTTISGMPPARAPITGRPDDMASSTTSPSVSVRDGMTNTSLDA